MKNFQQTPKQRRVDMAKQKQRLQSSKPLIVFRQESYQWSQRNHIYYILRKR